MKRRLGLVSNSSSSSYIIRDGAKDLPVWPIFLAAAVKDPYVDIDLHTDTVTDEEDNGTFLLCHSLGIDVGTLLKQTSHI